MQDLGDTAARALIERRSDRELADLMTNLGGHDLPTLIEAFTNAGRERPVCFICYTIKGMGLPFAGHKDNHSGLMTVAQMDVFRDAMNVRAGHEWDAFEGLPFAPDRLQAFLDAVPFAARAERRHRAATFDIPASLPVPAAAVNSTQAGLRRDPQRPRQGNDARSSSASSPRRRTSRSPPISAAGSTGACCLVAKRPPTCFATSTSPRPSTGAPRRKASTSSSALPR